MTGIEVLALVNFYLNDDTRLPHREATPEARQWLTQAFPTLTTVIEGLLKDIHRRAVERFSEE